MKEANSFSADILIQASDPGSAASFYINSLGFTIAEDTSKMVSLCGKHINLFIERGPALGPVLEVTVDNVDEARLRLVKQGCKVLKDEPEFRAATSRIRTAWFTT